MLELDHCPSCQNDNLTTLLERPDRLTDSPIVFRYQQCQACHLISLSPQPSMEELASYYPQYYESFVESTNFGDTLPRYLVNQYEKQRNLISPYKSGGQLLDVGCGSGAFLYHVEQFGWQVKGVEPSSAAAEQARQRYNLDIVTGDLGSSNYADHQFDVVTLWDVFEHLPNPQTTLHEIGRITAYDGLLLLTIPNLKSFDAALFKRYWIGWDAPRHLHLYPLETVELFLTQAEFEIIQIRSFGGEYGAFTLSLQTYLWGRTSLNQSQSWLGQMVMITIRLTLLPYFWLSRYLNRSTIIAIIAQKKVTAS